MAILPVCLLLRNACSSSEQQRKAAGAGAALALLADTLVGEILSGCPACQVVGSSIDCGLDTRVRSQRSFGSPIAPKHISSWILLLHLRSHPPGFGRHLPFLLRPPPCSVARPNQPNVRSSGVIPHVQSMHQRGLSHAHGRHREGSDECNRPFSFTFPQGVRDERFVSQKQFKLLRWMAHCCQCVTEAVAHHTNKIRDVATYARKSS